MATTTYIQAESLLEDLKGARPPQGRVSWQVGKIANALLAKAQAEEPDNVVLATIEPFKPGVGGTYIEGMFIDDVRAIVGQIIAATRTAPSIG
jgi:hypothetical protein